MAELESKEQKKLVDFLLNAKKTTGKKAALEALSRVPEQDLQATLHIALKTIKQSGQFAIASRLIVEHGGEIGLRAMQQYAADSKKWPAIAMRSINRSDHDLAFEIMVSVLQNGATKQRCAAAKYLGERRDLRAVIPLSKMVKAPSRSSEVPYAALGGLKGMGAPRVIAEQILQKPIIPSVRTQMIAALNVMPDGLFAFAFGTRFDPEKFIKQAARRRGPLQEAAREVLQKFEEPRTLLRSASSEDTDTLLRVARGPGESDPDKLLRVAEEEEFKK